VCLDDLLRANFSQSTMETVDRLWPSPPAADLDCVNSRYRHTSRRLLKRLAAVSDKLDLEELMTAMKKIAFNMKGEAPVNEDITYWIHSKHLRLVLPTLSRPAAFSTIHVSTYLINVLIYPAPHLYVAS
jgi:hypothetical protein